MILFRRINGMWRESFFYRGSLFSAWFRGNDTFSTDEKCIWRNCYHLANLHSGHVGRTLAAIAYIVYIGKNKLNQIVVLRVFKHKKPASQFILYVPIDPIGPNLVSLIRNSEFDLQTNFCSEAPYSSHCNGCQNLRKMQTIAFLTSKSIGYLIWINKARI